MPKDTKSLGNNKAPACESRGFVHKKRGVHFDTPPFIYFARMVRSDNVYPYPVVKVCFFVRILYA